MYLFCTDEKFTVSRFPCDPVEGLDGLYIITNSIFKKMLDKRRLDV
jgi:hypothetical protein